MSDRVRGRVRPLRVLSVAMLLALLPAPATAEGGDCSERTEAGMALAASVAVERVTCTGDAWSVAVTDPNGRTELRWYDDERGVGVELHRPPRFAAWWEDGEGCHLILYAFGAEEIGCVAGAPPPPPALLP